MLDILIEGKARYGIAAVKAEFEAEGTRVDELLRLLEIARRAGVKVGLKIGGCEAIRDLIECRQFGVDYVIAPMVETPYALSKFAAAVDKVFPADERAEIGFLFNVETISTYDKLAEMAKIAGEAKIGMVFGRVDFAGSLGKDRGFVNSDAMIDHVVEVAKAAREQGVDLVVGGGVSPESIEPLRRVRAAKLDRFETRKVIFDASVLDGGDIEAGLALAIEFELLWLKNKRDYYVSIGAEDETRIDMMEKRQQVKAPVRAVA
ncbi:MAG: aldolase [Sphingomonadales bacterium]|nr:MAG: aldolase [Sphingomonadales bacterium]